MSFDPHVQVSSADLAQVLGMTERRVQQLEKEGVFKNVAEGRNKRFRLSDAVQAWKKKSEIEAERTIQESTGSDDLFKSERARKLKLENDLTEGTLLETDSAIAAIDHIVGQIRTGLAGIPARYTDDLVERRKLEMLHDDVLRDLSARNEQAGAALREGRDPLEADATHHAG